MQCALTMIVREMDSMQAYIEYEYVCVCVSEYLSM